MILGRLLSGVALFVAANLPTAFGQASSNVTCQAQYLWMINSKNQTPCLASAYLSGQCNGGQWNVPTLGGTGPYSHPTGAAANLCRCNTVVYNLIQACSVCQGGVIGGWVDWVSNCTAGNITVGKYPLPLPGGVAVPNWAYLDFTQQDQFQTQVAQQVAGTSPESMSGPAPTGIQTVATTRSATYSISTPRASNTAASSTDGNGGSSTNTAAIVGGAVGGVLGLALLALIAWFLFRKKPVKKDPAPMEQTAPAGGYAGQPGYAAHETGYPVQQPFGGGHYTPVPSQVSPYDQTYGEPATPYKPYDPSDPSTFPTTPGPGSGPTIHSQGPTYSEFSHPSQPRPGQYNYAAEI